MSSHDGNDDSGAREPDGHVQTGGGEVDPEDKATEVWAPVARNLFKDELLAKVMRNAGGPAISEANPALAPRPRKPAGAGAEKTPPPVVVKAPPPDPHETSTSPGFEPAVEHSRPHIRRIDPEEQPTVPVETEPEPEELPTLPEEDQLDDPTLPESLIANQCISGELVARASSEPEEQDTEQTPVMVDGMDGQTINMSPDERAASIAAAGGAGSEVAFRKAQAEASRLLSASVEINGEEGQAARRLAAEARLRAMDDTESTIIVETPGYVKPVPHECRICGHKITKPQRRRLRGPVHSVNGFRCEECYNVFCAVHVERVSGLWESLTRGARFRCLLCMEDAKRGMAKIG